MVAIVYKTDQMINNNLNLSPVILRKSATRIMKIPGVIFPIPPKVP